MAQFTTRQITPEFGCEISGLDVRRLAEPAILAEIKAVSYTHLTLPTN